MRFLDIYGVGFFGGFWIFFECGVGMKGRLVIIRDDFDFGRFLEMVKCL